jgi:hypothetical protein
MSRGVVFGRIFFRLFHLVLFVGSALWLLQLPVLASQDVTLTWVPNTDPGVVGYKLYFGLESYSYTTSVDVGDVAQAMVTLPVSGATYFFAATTYDEDGNESDFSTESTVVAVPGGGSPGALSPALTQAGMVNGVFGFTVNGTAGTQYVVEASTNLVNWVALTTNAVPFAFNDPAASQFSQRFYRSSPLVEFEAATALSPALTQAGLADGVFGFTVNGAAGTQYVVEASTNLVDWAGIATNTVPFAFTDPNSASFSQRFYRSRPL